MVTVEIFMKNSNLWTPSHLLPSVASLLSCLHQLRQENLRLEQHISTLVQRRDHLLAVNARLSLPLTQGGTIANAMGLGVGAGGDNSPGSAGSGSNSRSPRFNNVLHNAQGQVSVRVITPS